MRRERAVILGALLCVGGAQQGSAAIVSSEMAIGHAQADGRRYITERHTFEDASVVIAVSLADATGAEDRMKARIADLERQQTDAAAAKAEVLLRDSAVSKLDAWLLTGDDAAIKTETRLTDAELEALRVARGKAPTE